MKGSEIEHLRFEFLMLRQFNLDWNSCFETFPSMSYPPGSFASLICQNSSYPPATNSAAKASSQFLRDHLHFSTHNQQLATSAAKHGRSSQVNAFLLFVSSALSSIFFATVFITHSTAPSRPTCVQPVPRVHAAVILVKAPNCHKVTGSRHRMFIDMHPAECKGLV
jgi:hypothetical protein